MCMWLVKTQYKLLPQALIINNIYYMDVDIISAVTVYFEPPFLSERFHTNLRVIFSENRVSEDTHEKSIFLLFRQNIPLSELIQGKIV